MYYVSARGSDERTINVHYYNILKNVDSQSEYLLRLEHLPCSLQSASSDILLLALNGGGNHIHLGAGGKPG